VIREWQVAGDGTRVLTLEGWHRHGREHRPGGPSHRRWTVGPDGTRTVHWEKWYVNGKPYRVDGPAYAGHEFYWHGRGVTQQNLQWLRRGRVCMCLVASAVAFTLPTTGSEGSPAWTRDARVAMTRTQSPSAAPYRSAVGGAVMLCV